MLKREILKTEKDQDWFIFSSSLFRGLCADYILFRLNYHLDPLIFMLPLLQKSTEIVEKSLKFFIVINNIGDDHIILRLKNEFRHNLEKLREQASNYEHLFLEDDIKTFTLNFSDKSGYLYQYFRYGSSANIGMVSANLNEIIQVVDKIFFSSLNKLPDVWRNMFHSMSPLHFLVISSNAAQSHNQSLLMEAINKDNKFIDEFINHSISLQ